MLPGYRCQATINFYNHENTCNPTRAAALGKYKLIDTTPGNTMAEGGVEKIGSPDGFSTQTQRDGSKAILELGKTDHQGSIMLSSTCSPTTSAASRAMPKSTQ